VTIATLHCGCNDHSRVSQLTNERPLDGADTHLLLASVQNHLPKKRDYSPTFITFSYARSVYQVTGTARRKEHLEFCAGKEDGRFALRTELRKARRATFCLDLETPVRRPFPFKLSPSRLSEPGNIQGLPLFSANSRGKLWFRP
jgi:hypothetical protein